MAFEQKPVILPSYEIGNALPGEIPSLQQVLAAVRALNAVITDESTEQWLMREEENRSALIRRREQLQQGLELAEQTGKLKRQRVL